MKSSATILSLLIIAGAVGVAHADGCAAIEKLPTKGTRNVSDTFLQNLRTVMARASPEECESYASVLGALFNGKSGSGRQLEEERPLDIAEAQKNFNQALQDAPVRDRLEAAQKDIADENVRLVYEAVVLDSEGYYNARELRISQVLQQLK